MPDGQAGRRWFLGAAGATVLGAVGWRSSTDAETEDATGASSPYVAWLGRFRGAGDSGIFLDIEDGVRTVVMAEGAAASRGPAGPLASLASYRPGERLCAIGVIDRNGVMHAQHLGSVFQETTDTVKNRSGMRIETARGDTLALDHLAVSLTQADVGRLGATAFRPGLHFNALIWIDDSNAKNVVSATTVQHHSHTLLPHDHEH